MGKEDDIVIRPNSYYFDNDYKFSKDVSIEVRRMPSINERYGETYVATVHIASVDVYQSPRLSSSEEAAAAAKVWLRFILENGKRVLENE